MGLTCVVNSGNIAIMGWKIVWRMPVSGDRRRQLSVAQKLLEVYTRGVAKHTQRARGWRIIKGGGGWKTRAQKREMCVLYSLKVEWEGAIVAFGNHARRRWWKRAHLSRVLRARLSRRDFCPLYYHSLADKPRGGWNAVKPANSEMS